MPLILEGQEYKAPESLQGVQDIPKETGFKDAAKAFFATEDTLFRPVANMLAPKTSNKFDPNFDPLTRLEEERPDLADYAENFINVRNSEEYNKKVFDIDYELEQKEIFARANTSTKIAAGIAASVIDPLMLVPFVGAAKKASTLARVGEGAVAGTKIGLGTSAAREAILQGAQETRTAEESAINILAESALGGILGGAVGAFASPVRTATARHLSKMAQGKDFKIDLTGDTPKVVPDEGGSAGAAAVVNPTHESQSLAHINETFAKIASGPEFLRAPDLRAATSKSPTLNMLGETLYNSNFIRKKNIEGIPNLPNAQNAINAAENKFRTTMKNVDKLYLKHTGQTSLGSTLRRAEGKVSHLEFSERISKNLRDAARVDTIDEVNKASKIMRKDLDDVAKKLQEAKLLDPDLDPKTMSNYLTRIYDHGKLATKAQRNNFISKVSSWVRMHNKDGTARKSLLSQSEADEIADDILEKILGRSEQQIAMSGVADNFISKGKFLKERQLMIPDSEIEEFLVNDSMRLYNNYMSRATKLLEVQKALNNAGFENIQDVIRGIQADADLALKEVTDPKVAAKIQKDFDKDIDLAKKIYRSMLGQLRNPGKSDRYAEALLNYQFVRLLGGVTISSFPEAVMVPFRKGFLNTLRDGYLPMIRSLKESKASKDQLNDLIGAMDFEQNNILRSLGGIDDIERVGQNQNAWDKFSNVMTSGFTKATGIGHWTTMHRRIAAQVSSADIIRTLKRGPKGKEIERLAAMGIGKDDYASILAQIDKHVTRYKGTFATNIDLWTDQTALQKFRNAIQSDIESTILKPGAESLPLFVQENVWSRLLFQFKSFSNAATGKVFLSALQRRDRHVLSGLMALTAMGSLSGIAHDLIAGRDISDDPAEILMDGIARSGFLGLIGTTVLDSGLTYYNESTRRYGADNLSGAILGPTIGSVDDMVKTVERFSDGEVTDKDWKAAQRMMPFGNLFYIKGLTNKVFKEE